jgi:serine/threonine-protein kinase HipA
MAGKMSNQLDIYLNAKRIAQIFLQNDQLLWDYTDDWRANGFPISPHLPFLENIPSLNVQRFLRNLLPEGPHLDELTSYYNLSKNNTYALIRMLGLDMPGALVALPAGEKIRIKSNFRILQNNELTQRLNDREHYSLMIWDGKPRLSVAGVQDKINVVLDSKGNIGFGEGALCSTHILKFEKQKLAHLVMNEYFTMQLASQCGLEVAKTQLIYFDKHATLLVERFDREFISKSEVKRHQKYAKIVNERCEHLKGELRYIATIEL